MDIHYAGESPIDGYYQIFSLPTDVSVENPLRQLLHEVWTYRYPDLYERLPDDRPVGEISHSCERLLSFLISADRHSSHRRLLYLGWALGLAVAPTLAYITPDDTRPEQVLDAIRMWLDYEQRLSLDSDLLVYPQDVGLQALNEGRLVFVALARALDPAQAQQELLDMLDACLEGYAIFPGSRLRRDLFNWVLVDAIPAAWNMRLPNAIYDTDGPWRFEHFEAKMREIRASSRQRIRKE